MHHSGKVNGRFLGRTPMVAIGLALLVLGTSGFGQFLDFRKNKNDARLFQNELPKSFRKLADEQTDSILNFLYLQSADFTDFMRKQPALRQADGCWEFVNWVIGTEESYEQPVMDNTWIRGLPDSSDNRLYVLNFFPDYSSLERPLVAHIGIVYRGQFWSWSEDNIYIESLGTIPGKHYAATLVAKHYISYYKSIAPVPP